MKVLFVLALLIVPASAFALDDSIIRYCFTTANPQSCIQSFNADVQRHQLDMQRELLQSQMEMARIQANGLMLFGSGPAFINGMNQGFQNMQQPYVSTPYFTHPPHTR